MSFELGHAELSRVDATGRTVLAGVGERWEVEVGDVEAPARASVSVV